MSTLTATIPHETPLVDRPPAPATTKFRCVDILRGLAAPAVLLYHANGFFWRTPAPEHPSLARTLADLLFDHGNLGVPLFFVISGFCIHLPYAGKPRVAVRPFLVRRFWRIYPPYLAVLLICFTLMGVQYGAAAGVTWQNLVGHLCFYYGFANTRMGITPVFWTVSLEVQFYLLYLLLFPLLRRVGMARATIAFLVLGVAYRVLATVMGIDGISPLFSSESTSPFRFGEWLLGAWIADALVLRRMGGTCGPLDTPARRVAIGAALVAVSAALNGMNTWAVHQYSLVATLGFAIMMAGLIQFECRRQVRHPGLASAPRQAPAESWPGRVATWLAERSYSLYLVHFTVVASLGVAYARIAHVADRDAMSGTPLWLIVTLLGVAGSFATAELLYRFIEAPSHRLARRRSAARAARERQPEASAKSAVAG